MHDLLNIHIANHDLNQVLHCFVEGKNHFYFCELAFYHYKSFGGTDIQAIETLAVGIELLILSFDIFDDLEDEDSLEAPWMKTNHSVALNAATALYTLSIKIISTISNEPLFFQKLMEYTLQSMQGQHDDITNLPSTEDECLDMIKRKSGSLTALPCVLGTMLATGEFNPTVETYAFQLGIASQIENDYKALFSDSNSDISKKKRTLAYLYLARQFNQASINLLKKFETEDKISNQEIQCYKAELQAAGVTQYMHVMHQLAIQKFKKDMAKLGERKELADFILGRLEGE
ncbi:isoprenyl transferase [Bacillus sp. WMMC1349]|uniref:polyprenyl synthetase family protein n=1 Tax=Bacillus sp. WMMC1349 TaxID=2736254 RepID=UPI0015549C93|nr:polyprenyl synthetase family protein [Bacillus sp. WMMC1349]NPC93980.1 isoprenyl transferase [Bacillus sp. WMMC1349]